MGLFVSIEGSDGSGKTTVVHHLTKELEKRNIDVVSSREPGGIRIAEKIRDLILDPENTDMSAATEALLYAASRSQHIDQKIKPALQEGKVVICDRFVDSSLAYQGVGRGLGIDEVYSINLFAIKDAIPDLTIFLDINAETARKRVESRENLDRLELEEDAFHQKVKQGYNEICSKFKERIVVVDANRSLEVIIPEILNLILEKYEATK